jgi:hypothetical protein
MGDRGLAPEGFRVARSSPGSCAVSRPETLDPQHLPVWMQPPIMRSAMSTLNAFSEKERDYHRYQSRQEALRVQRAVAYELEDRRAAEQAALQGRRRRPSAKPRRPRFKPRRPRFKPRRPRFKTRRPSAKPRRPSAKPRRPSAKPKRPRSGTRTRPSPRSPASRRFWTSRRSADTWETAG